MVVYAGAAANFYWKFADSERLRVMEWHLQTAERLLLRRPAFLDLAQALRRCWRFGQEKPVTAYVVTSDAEGAVVQNVKRKEREATETMAKIVQFTHDAVAGRNTRQEAEYREDVAEGGAWTLHLGDSIEVVKRLPDESVALSVFSPPFPGMYTYSNSVRDMGNAKGISAIPGEADRAE